LRCRPDAWREVQGQRLSWLPVWPGPNNLQTGLPARAPLGLLVEEQANGSLAFMLGNQVDGTAAIRLWESRQMVAVTSAILQRDLGLDHFEGRSWRGFHHHAVLVLLAYAFLLWESH
jgi:hypothetical protein